MKNILQLILIFQLLFQGYLTQAFATNASKIADSDSSSDRRGNDVCEHCLPKDLKSGDIVSVDDNDYRLDEIYNDQGDWSATKLGPTSKEPNEGKSVDETFGQGADSDPNPERSRWLNGRLSKIDDYLDSERTPREDAEKVRQKVMRATTQESLRILESFKTNRAKSLGTSDGYFCQDQNCNELLESLRFSKPGLANIGTLTSEQYLNELHSHLPIPTADDYALDSAVQRGKSVDTAPYTSFRKEELESLRNKLTQKPVRGPQQWDAKLRAFVYLRESDFAFLTNDIFKGELFLKAGMLAIDIATDLIPITSIPKDTYRLVIGKDPLSGERLSPFERVLSGAFILGAVVTAGATNVFKELKEVQVLAKATSEEAKVAEKVVQKYKAAGELEQIASAPDKWSRLPKSLHDQMAMEEALVNDGKHIMKDTPLNDPRYAGMQKYEYTLNAPGGGRSVIHYVLDPKTGKRMDFKFKQHSIDPVRIKRN